MTTSDMLSRLYPEPSSELKRQQHRLTQQLLSMPSSIATGTSAPSGQCFSGSKPTCSSWHAPYLTRVAWLLTNSQGHYLAAIHGAELSWVDYPNAVPEEHRYSTHQKAKAVWVQLSELLQSQDVVLAVRPIDFYAHPASPHYWCALDDQL